MSEPTKAAMKAANRLRHTVRTQQFRTESQLDTMDAAIIDRETGLPELVAALRRIYEMKNGQDLLNIGRQIAWDALRKAGEL